MRAAANDLNRVSRVSPLFSQTFRGDDVAHALMRAASALMPTPGAARMSIPHQSVETTANTAPFGRSDIIAVVAQLARPMETSLDVLRLGAGLPERVAARIQMLLAAAPNPQAAARLLERLRQNSPSAFDRIASSPAALRAAV